MIQFTSGTFVVSQIPVIPINNFTTTLSLYKQIAIKKNSCSCILNIIIHFIHTKAKITRILPIKTGTSAKGEWRKQNIIVDSMSDISRKICITIWGDKINEAQLQIGNEMQINFDLERREYNCKWNTDALALNIILISEGPTPPEVENTKQDDDLPF